MTANTNTVLGRKRFSLWRWLTPEKKAAPAAELPRFCRDCRHRRDDTEKPGDREFDGCWAPQNMVAHPVDGLPFRRVRFCVTHRVWEPLQMASRCGPSARWFEPIDKEVS